MKERRCDRFLLRLQQLHNRWNKGQIGSQAPVRLLRRELMPRPRSGSGSSASLAMPRLGSLCPNARSRPGRCAPVGPFARRRPAQGDGAPTHQLKANSSLRRGKFKIES